MIYKMSKPWRIKRYFIWVTTFEGYWFNEDTREWSKDPDWSTGCWSTCAYCRTIRSYRRMLRKHPELKGKSVLVNRYIGYDVKG